MVTGLLSLVVPTVYLQTRNPSYPPLGPTRPQGGLARLVGPIEASKDHPLSDPCRVEVVGGIFCHSSSPIITNCIIATNMASFDGGGIFCFSASPIVTNCTIVENISSYGGGIHSAFFASPVIKNTILWGNTAQNNGNEVHLQHNQSSITITFSDVQTGIIGITGNGTIILDVQVFQLSSFVVKE